MPVIPLSLIRVLPSPFRPVAPSSACIPLLAKYVKEFSHSILTPFVAVNASTPGVINVTLWKSMLASLLAAFATDPSAKIPLPASP